jgi:NADH-quinone oxidoreductase subunit M
MNLLLLLGIPLITALLVLMVSSKEQVRWVSFVGSAAQLIAAFLLFFAYRVEIAAHNNAQFLFEIDYTIIQSFNIHFHLGVDGISVAMILLTSFVVVAGILVSWNIEKMTK